MAVEPTPAACALTSLTQNDIGSPASSRQAEEPRGFDGSEVLARIVYIEAHIEIRTHPLARDPRLLLTLFGQPPQGRVPLQQGAYQQEERWR